MLKEFYTTGEVAKLIGISDGTVKNYCSSGQIGSDKTPITNYRRISREQIIAFLEKHNLPLSILKHKTTKVLVVDDELEILDLFIAMISGISKEVLIETAQDGYDACIKAGIMIPDVILLDLKMRKADGFEVCRSIRSNDKTKHAKIIVITGHATEENLQRLREFRALEVFEKPFDIGKLEKKLRLLLNGTGKH